MNIEALQSNVGVFRGQTGSTATSPGCLTSISAPSSALPFLVRTIIPVPYSAQSSCWNEQNVWRVGTDTITITRVFTIASLLCSSYKARRYSQGSWGSGARLPPLLRLHCELWTGQTTVTSGSLSKAVKAAPGSHFHPFLIF